MFLQQKSSLCKKYQKVDNIFIILKIKVINTYDCKSKVNI